MTSRAGLEREVDEPNVWVTVPTYEEAENIERLIRGVREAVPAAHILVIDDNSLDGTAEKATKATKAKKATTTTAAR